MKTPTTIPETILHQERMKVFRAKFLEFWNTEVRPELLRRKMSEREIAKQMIVTWPLVLEDYFGDKPEWN